LPEQSYGLSHSFRFGPPAPIDEAAAYFTAGDNARAEACCLAILQHDPQHFDALHMLGVLCFRRNALADAVSFLRRAERVSAAVAQLQANIGHAYMGLALHHEAELAFRRALRLSQKPEAGLLNDLGTAQSGAGRHADSEATFRAALALSPGFQPARFNLGSCLAAQGRHEEAACLFRLVLDGRVEDPERQQAVASALALAYGALGRYEDAASVCGELLTHQPRAAIGEWNESLALLSLGRFREGLERYEARWRVETHDKPHPRGSVLDLGTVAGRHVLVVAEQGRGDLLQFARYAQMLAARGARVTLQVYADVAPVVRGMPGVRVITTEDVEPEADSTTPLLSLPRAFGTTVATIPDRVPYLIVPPDRLEAWRVRLGPRQGPRIGLAWRGLQHIPHRTMPVAALAPLLQLGGASFHALQKEIEPSDRDWLSRHGIEEHSGALQDFGDTAALISSMDVVITIDTAVAHLAGGLAAPVWVMLPFSADWRWLTGREDSPWYPTARLFRQKIAGGWADVVEQVSAALVERFGSATTAAEGRGGT
jgi:tetratricopeptide (TPR) repeat protein